MVIHGKEFEKMLSKEQLEERIQFLAEKINADYAGKSLLVVVVLNGAYVFATDLLRKLTLEIEICFVKFVSYEGLTSSGTVDEVIGLDKDIHQKEVLVIEDIVDTGLTMSEILRLLKSHQPKSLETATLLLKPESIKKEIPLKYVGFSIPSDYVVGFGLDFDGFGRNLPELYKLKPE